MSLVDAPVGINTLNSKCPSVSFFSLRHCDEEPVPCHEGPGVASSSLADLARDPLPKLR